MPGEEIRVDTGNLVAFQSGIGYSVEKVGGIKSTILGGEGLVLRLKGPGAVRPDAVAGHLRRVAVPAIAQAPEPASIGH
jgi:uncharacterized protein (AIM24 family)